MANNVAQTIRDAEIDARSLSEFISKDASFTVTRRLAPTIHTLDYYLLVLNKVKEKGDLADIAISDTLKELDRLEPTVIQRVEDAINNTAVEGGVLADTFVTATVNGVGAVPRTQREKNQETISVLDFGAKADSGITDNREPFQKALDYLVSVGGGVLHIPSGAGNYHIKTLHPTSDCALELRCEGSQYSRGNIKITGTSHSKVMLDSSETCDSLLSVPVRANYLTFDEVVFSANNKASYAVNASVEYCPYMTVRKSIFSGGTAAAFRVATYVSSITDTIFSNSKVGVQITGVGGNIVTSTNLTSCYAINCDDIGYQFGYLTYSSLINCACDASKLAYSFDRASGVVMTACGAERVGKLVHVIGYRGMQINGFYSLSCGGTDEEPTEHMIELGSGFGGTVSGIIIENPKPYKYKLSSTGSSYGFEGITVLDDSVSRGHISWAATYDKDRPIKLLVGDSSTRDATHNVSTLENFREKVRTLEGFNLNHTQILNFAAGTYDFTANPSTFKKITGSGELVLSGVSGDASAVVIYTDYMRLQFLNSNVQIRLKDLTIAGKVSSGSNIRLIIDNCPNVILDNVIITNGGRNAGVGVRAKNNSHVKMINNSAVIGTYQTAPWDIDTTSSVKLLPQESTPAGHYPINTTYQYIDPVAVGFVGAVYTNTGWKNYGALEVEVEVE